METGIARAHGLSHAFLALIREHRGADLKAWRAETIHRGLDALTRFRRGLQEDLAAVTAGRTLGWSNGPVDGPITRLL
jgi:transposase